MSVQRIALDRKKGLVVLLEEALALIPEQGALTLYYDGKESYEMNKEGIKRYWKSQYANGDPVTDSEIVSSEAFVSWAQRQPSGVQQQVYQSLADYVTPVDPRDRKERVNALSDNILRY